MIYYQQEKILIIKFGGLGDIVLSFDAIFAIFKHHRRKLILLTEKPFDDFLYRSKWFEKIITIERNLFYFKDISNFKKLISEFEFDYVYDLQTSKRTSHYLKIFIDKKTITNGIGKYSKIPHTNIYRNHMHTIERQKDQLNLCNVDYKSKTNLDWLFGSSFPIPKKNYVIVVPGGSKKRINKRIPLNLYCKILDYLINSNLEVLIIGSKDDKFICTEIEKKVPGVKNLCCKTNLFDIAKLSKYSLISVGNDTGPMHLIAKGGKQTFVFFTKFSEPELCKPIGKKVSVFTYKNNNQNFYDEVISKIKNVIKFLNDD